jgi:hypothetical protein
MTNTSSCLVGLFLVAYYLLLVVICIPIVYVQMKVGAVVREGVLGIFSQYVPLLKGKDLFIVGWCDTDRLLQSPWTADSSINCQPSFGSRIMHNCPPGFTHPEEIRASWRSLPPSPHSRALISSGWQSPDNRNSSFWAGPFLGPVLPPNGTIWSSSSLKTATEVSIYLSVSLSFNCQS